MIKFTEEEKRERNRARVAEWRKNNPERDKEIRKKHYENNKDAYIERVGKWAKHEYHNNPEFRAKLRDRVTKRRNALREANPVAYNKKTRDYQRKSQAKKKAENNVS